MDKENIQVIKRLVWTNPKTGEYFTREQIKPLFDFDSNFKEKGLIKKISKISLLIANPFIWTYDAFKIYELVMEYIN